MADDSYPYEAKRRVVALIDSMKTLLAEDAEQEIRGIALAVVDAAIAAAKAAKPDDPVVASIADLFSPEQLETGEPPRAADVLVVAQQLDAAIGNPAPPPTTMPQGNFPPPMQLADHF